MAKTGNFYHHSTINTAVANIGTTFDKAKVHAHRVHYNPSSLDNNAAFQDNIEGFYIRVTNIAGGSAKPIITLRVTCDADGDLPFFPDTDGEVALGVTTTNSGVSVYEFKLPLFTPFFDISTLQPDRFFVFIKIDQGTCTLANSMIVWSE